jgi:sugar/nucleoside kinase (ribokinase family)
MGILCSGSFVADILVPDLPQIGPPGSLTYAPNGIHLSPGGHSANVAINLAQLETGDIHAVGSIGEDEMGKFLLEQLRNRGVNPLPEIYENSTTAKNVALLVKNQDRRYIAELTANSLLTTRHLQTSIKAINPDIIYQGTLGGLPDVERNLPSILERTIKDGILNYIDVIMPSNGWEYLKPSLPYIHIFHANRLEASNFTGETNPQKALRKITEGGVKLAIITDAHNGAIAGSNTHLIEMPAYQVAQRDPTGAGDALSAGIINYIKQTKIRLDELTKPELIVELLLYGQATGASCVTGLGATTNVTMKNVKKLLTQQKDRVHKQTRLKRL